MKTAPQRQTESVYSKALILVFRIEPLPHGSAWCMEDNGRVMFYCRDVTCNQSGSGVGLAHITPTYCLVQQRSTSIGWVQVY